LTSLKGSTGNKVLQRISFFEKGKAQRRGLEIGEGIIKVIYYRTGRLPQNTQIIPSEVACNTVISQIPLMVGNISVKSEDLFER
jgi:hypothetical protein